MASSSSRRSAKEVRATHQITGKPVWTTNDSEQIVSLSPLRQPDFVMWDEFWISSGVLDIEPISLELSILQGISSIYVMRKAFYGTQPSLLLVHPLEETESLHKVIDQLVSLLTTMGDLDSLLYRECLGAYRVSYDCMALKDPFPAMPYHVCQMDRLIGSTSKVKA